MWSVRTRKGANPAPPSKKTAWTRRGRARSAPRQFSGVATVPTITTRAGGRLAPSARRVDLTVRTSASLDRRATLTLGGPPAFMHRSSSEGKEPGCASLAQPARIESTHSPPVMCESPGLASSRLIVSPLGCRRQSEACRTQFVALGLFLVRGRDDREGATTEPDAAMGERGTTAPLIRAEGAPSWRDRFWSLCAGRRTRPAGDARGNSAMASACEKYVAIDATTTRASTVIKSMPTSETRTQASKTMPLSSTRSRASMRLLLLEARSITGPAALSAAWAPWPLTPADEESDHGANAPPGSPDSVRAGTQWQAERPSPRARRSYGRATIWRIAWSARRPRQKPNDHRWRGDIGPWSSRRARPSRLSADAAFLGGLDGGLPARHDQASLRLELRWTVSARGATLSKQLSEEVQKWAPGCRPKTSKWRPRRMPRPSNSAI